jgi:hypothetical protein
MILTDVHVELLKGIRPKIERALGSAYICVLLEYAVLERYQVDEFEDDPEAMQIYTDLTTAIREALDEYATVYVYLANVVPDFNKLPSHVQDYYTVLARIAWLDKMIETRTIA